MSDVDGVQVMKTAKELHPEIEVIIVTGYATVNSAVDAMAQGAFYYLSKPIKLKELHALVLRATEKTHASTGNQSSQATNQCTTRHNPVHWSKPGNSEAQGFHSPFCPA